MLEKLKIMYSKLRNLILYGLFGGMAACLDYLVFFIMLYFNIISNKEIASLCGNAVGFIFTFTLNSFVNFKKKDRLCFRFFSYAIICILGAGISTLLIYVFKGAINPYILKLGVMAVVCIIQFILNKIITYKN